MKKAVTVTAIILILGIIGGAIAAHIVKSPEYAMTKTIADVKKSGMEGLKAHLTDDTREKIEKVNDFLDNPFISGLLSSAEQTETVTLLKEKISEIQWEVRDIMKGKLKTNVTVGFNYNDKVVGTIDVILIKENKEWKIDGIEAPKIEKFSID